MEWCYVMGLLGFGKSSERTLNGRVRDMTRCGKISHFSTDNFLISMAIKTLDELVSIGAS